MFTLPKYIETYNHDKLKDFLADVFSNRLVLFLGYGLSEFEVLEYLILHKGNIANERPFFVKGYSQLSEDLWKHDEIYYGEMGIDVVPFSTDVKGYDTLYETIKYWSEEIRRRSIHRHQDYDELRGLVRGR